MQAQVDSNPYKPPKTPPPIMIPSTMLLPPSNTESVVSSEIPHNMASNNLENRSNGKTTF